MNETVKESSVVDKNVEPVEKDQFSMATWGTLTILVIAFFVLKSFIYIKDDKRHGK